MNGMYKSTEIAGWLINKGIDTALYLTNLSVNKLTYFAHGYYYANHEDQEPLVFEQSFFAWKYGPVCSDVYTLFRDYGRSEIRERQFVNEIKLEVVEYLNAFWSEFAEKHKDPLELVHLSHVVGGAWYRTKQEGKKIIPESYIKDEFINTN